MCGRSVHVPYVIMAVYIVSGARTPFGAFNGALKTVPAPRLGAAASTAAISKAGLSPADIEEAYIGTALQGGVGQAPARQVVLEAGCPDTTEATTINKVCASGVKAIALAANTIKLGDRDIMLAGGMESMSRAPLYLPRAVSFGDVQARDAILADGLTDAGSQHQMGICAEHTAEVQKVSRTDQDAYALSSYDRAEAAWKAQLFSDEIAPVTITDRKGATTVAVDEEFSRLLRDKVPTLRPAFSASGTITAANASTLSDGAAAVVLASEEAVQRRGLAPLARIIGASLLTSYRRRGECAGGLCDRAVARNPACACKGRAQDRRYRTVGDQRGVLCRCARQYAPPGPQPCQGEHARRRGVARTPARRIGRTHRRHACACARSRRVRRRGRVQRAYCADQGGGAASAIVIQRM